LTHENEVSTLFYVNIWVLSDILNNYMDIYIIITRGEPT
jgi:hypothetical protein